MEFNIPDATIVKAAFVRKMYEVMASGVLKFPRRNDGGAEWQVVEGIQEGLIDMMSKPLESGRRMLSTRAVYL